MAASVFKLKWTPAEDAEVARLWPEATLPEIRSAIPGRSAASIRARARHLGIKCEHRRHLAKVVSPVIARDGVRGKACVACLTWKALEKFSRHATAAEGRRNVCTTCEGRAAYAANKKSKIEAVRRWQARNADKVRAYSRNKNARARGGAGSVSATEFAAVLAQYGGLCVYCRVATADTIDHVVPLARGGAHEAGNLVPACGACNRSKRDMTVDEWFDSARAMNPRRCKE